MTLDVDIFDRIMCGFYFSNLNFIDAERKKKSRAVPAKLNMACFFLVTSHILNKNT